MASDILSRLGLTKDTALRRSFTEEVEVSWAETIVILGVVAAVSAVLAAIGVILENS